MTPGERNLAAEVRAVEEGHRARLLLRSADAERRPLIVVKSDSKPGKEYHVEASAMPGGPVIFSCSPHGNRAYSDDHLHVDGELGIVPCKHAALAARRLEREGLIRLDGPTGCWLDTLPVPPLGDVDDLFAGLNR